MSVLIDTHGVVVDEWVWLDDAQALVAAPRLLVSIGRWREQRAHLRVQKGQFGVVLDPNTDVVDLQADLDVLDLIAIQFGVFSDGRGFSQARLLRERYGYSREIRAVGEVQRDQLAFMARCGITQFALESERDITAALAAFSEISVDYQEHFSRKVGMA